METFVAKHRGRPETTGEFVRVLGPDLASKMTTRQRQVLRLVAKGHTMKETAELLNVKPTTVAFHKHRIMEKYGLKRNADLVRLAIREGIISAD
jgi:DNA-binding CsgD family transcriptional regulator